jgi:MoxR-like ATPase
MCAVAASLAEVRGAAIAAPSVSLDAALIALSGRIRLREGSSRTAEDVVRELWEAVFGRRADETDDTEGKAGAPTSGATTSR